MTLFSIDFYDHDTKTTEIKQGYNPVFKSHFQFKSRMDSFYVQYLSSKKAKLDLYLADTGSDKGPKGVLLGSAEILLSELVFRDGFMTQGMSMKPGVIEKQLNIVPEPGVLGAQKGEGIYVGQLRIKMKLRNPLNRNLMALKIEELPEESKEPVQ